MMMGATKKKVIATGVFAFLIPVVVGLILFSNYKKGVDERIAELERQTKVVDKYVFTRNMVAGELVTAEDVKVVSVKEESAPVDSFSGDRRGTNKYLSQIIDRRLKINAEEKTIVTSSMLTDSGDGELNIDERYQEFNMILLPSDLDVGDFIDVRISMLEGEDYLVISGKEVKQLGESVDSNAVFLQLNEEEILRMTAAIIESYMNDGYKLYANKYVDPYNQLYTYKRVNYVEAFENALSELVAERQKFADEYPKDYLAEYKPDMQFEEVEKIISGDVKIVVESGEIATSEIAAIIGLSEKQTTDIRKALASGDQAILDLYNAKLVSTRKDMINTYPVKANVAKLIKEDPNILTTLKNKYDIAKLEAQRENLLEIPLYQYNDDGELEFLESLEKLQENIKAEIEAQKLERKEYLQNLLLEENSSKQSKN